MGINIKEQQTKKKRLVPKTQCSEGVKLFSALIFKSLPNPGDNKEIHRVNEAVKMILRDIVYKPSKYFPNSQKYSKSKKIKKMFVDYYKDSSQKDNAYHKAYDHAKDLVKQLDRECEMEYPTWGNKSRVKDEQIKAKVHQLKKGEKYIGSILSNEGVNQNMKLEKLLYREKSGTYKLSGETISAVHAIKLCVVKLGYSKVQLKNYFQPKFVDKKFEDKFFIKNLERAKRKNQPEKSHKWMGM